MDPQNWVSRYGDQLYNYAVARLGNHHLAEEVVQEALLDAVRSMAKFKGQSTEKTWLFGILKFKIADHYRRQWKLKRPLSLSDEANPEERLFDGNGKWIEDAFGGTLGNLELSELWQVVQRCLHALPRNQACVFVLSVLEEKKREDICNELAISAANLSVRLHRARLGLAKCVAEQWPM